jgi:hypothetical protein
MAMRALLRKAAPALALGATASFGLATVASADEAEHGLHPGNYPWPHDGAFSSYDHASIRRGHQVRGGAADGALAAGRRARAPGRWRAAGWRVRARARSSARALAHC